MSEKDTKGKELIVPEKNIFKRIFSALLDKIKEWFTPNDFTYNSNFDVAPKRDIIENKESSKEGKNNVKAKEMIDLSLKVSLMLKEWNKQRRMFIEGKQVTYKESKTEDGEKYSYYAINGKEVLSSIETDKMKKTRLVDYYVEEKETEKLGNKMTEDVRNPEKDIVHEEEINYETGKCTTKTLGPIIDFDSEDEKVIGKYEETVERDNNDPEFLHIETKQKINDIKTNEEHKIVEERTNTKDGSSFVKQVDGKVVYRENKDKNTGEVTIELFDKNGELSETHKFDKNDEPIATYGKDGKELVRKGYRTINGKTEEYVMLKPIRGIEKYPDESKIADQNDKQWERYLKTVKNVGVNFNIPKTYLVEIPINTKTVDIIGRAKEKIKELDKKEMLSQKEDVKKGEHEDNKSER